MIQLVATPASALADEPVHIRATGLLPSQVVTIKASLKDEKGNMFWSKALYRANEAGEVDLKQTPALGGDYVGIHPMGLFWSLKPEKAFRRLLKQDVMNSPFWVTLDLYDSIRFQNSAKVQPKASQVVQRWFSAPGVQRKQIREGRVRGALFLPPVLALAYFAYEDLPEELLEVDLEYFEEAANLLLAHPKILKPGVGVISVSKGAEIGLAMACYLKQVVASVCINGPNMVFGVPLRYRDLVMTPKHLVEECTQFHISGAVRLYRRRGDPRDELNHESLLPVEKAQGSILFIVGENDECMNSRACAEQAMDQLRSHGRSSGRMLVYPGAGHLIEPPYSPLCFASWTRGVLWPLLWGGDSVGHAAAQEHAWGEIQRFFRQHLIGTRCKL
ncbi:Acyl-coenzyme A amino acid N-acyltransferase 2 [Tupaia chinensis]|uniref:Acyl-coenzyme A amino acid N-acyltransferase 2 n=1 Tax=Tupaia chinensis TaxID=246437 RepID=L9KZN0_TUPCH|nr:Acyl-coenzyme A amino acid N-acyltransferase 2 [Tupaia chinensis]